MEPYQPFTGSDNNNTPTTPDINTTNDADEHNKNTPSTNTFYNLPPEHFSNATNEQSAGSLTSTPHHPPSLQTDASVPAQQHQQEQWHNSSSLTNYPPYYPPPPPPFYQGPPQLQNNLPPSQHHHNNSQYDSLYYPPPAGGTSFPGMPPPPPPHLDFGGGKNCGELNEDDLDENRPVVTLENKSLWQEFNEAGTEMIITKTGR